MAQLRKRQIVEPAASPFRIPFNGRWNLAKAATRPPASAPDDKEARKLLRKTIEKLDRQQRKLHAFGRRTVLCVFQAMDAAGKDSTIRAVTSGLNPAGFLVSSFKKPSAEELSHDFLWRTTKRLPERGQIGIFNRSYYEEVLIVRVHPDLLEHQQLPRSPNLEDLWDHRFESIRDHELHLARSGTVILKFFLNVSKDEQKRRFFDRIDTKSKNWKFNADDLDERELWSEYMNAYEAVMQETSAPWAPWYAIPADNKPFMRATVAQILLETLESLDLRYPEPTKSGIAELKAARYALSEEGV